MVARIFSPLYLVQHGRAGAGGTLEPAPVDFGFGLYLGVARVCGVLRHAHHRVDRANR